MNYTAIIPAGQVGVWAGSGSASVKFDDVIALSMNSVVDIDGRWWDDVGGTALVSGKLEFSSADDVEQHAIRRGFRGGKYVFEYDHPVVDNSTHGVLVHYQDPENWMGVGLARTTGDALPILYRRQNGVLSIIATGSAVTLTNGDRVRIAIHDDPGDASLQELKVYVAGVLKMTSTLIDDTWSAGRAGFFVLTGGGSALGFDNVKIGFDNNSDDDVADAGDTILIDDDFASNVISLTYDNNGNMTDDGVFKFVYDAWNRLRKAQLAAAGDTTDMALYEYYPDNRRSEKIVQNLGDEETPNDGGNITVRFYYAGVAQSPSTVRWNIVETRNGSNQTTFQYLWGTQYVDELIWIEKNGDPTESNDTDPDDQTGESTADQRYFVHQDRNWNVTALSEYDTGGSNNGRIVERYSYTPYGSFVVLAGDSGNGELGNASRFSSIGNVFAHQGLPMDQEKGSYQNRWREFAPAMRRFAHRDPVGYVDGLNSYNYARSLPVSMTDPYGLATDCCADFFVARHIGPEWFSEHWCQDTALGDIMHPGQTCFRQTTCGEPGCHVCFDGEMNMQNCHAHIDEISPACGTDPNGRCIYDTWPTIRHIFQEVIPPIIEEIIEWCRTNPLACAARIGQLTGNLPPPTPPADVRGGLGGG